MTKYDSWIMQNGLKIIFKDEVSFEQTWSLSIKMERCQVMDIKAIWSMCH